MRRARFDTSAPLGLACDRIGGLERQRGHGQRAVAATARGHRAAAGQKQVRVIMGTAIQIDHRCRRIGAHDRAAHDVVAVGELGGHLETSVAPNSAASLRTSGTEYSLALRRT
jgi:hypothetical protein